MALISRWPGLMAGPFAPSGRRVAARRRTPGGLGPRARPRPRCGLGLGAALRAGRKRPGPRPSPPHTPPARLGSADGKARGCQPCGLVGAPVRALWARPVRGRNLARRALGPCPLCGSRPLSAPRAAGARGYAACGRDGHTGEHPARPRQAACGGPCLMISGAAEGDKVTRPPVAGHQPTNHRSQRKDAEL